MRTECTAGQTPPWALNLTGVALEAAVRKRISDALGHFNGTVSGWDVMNEMTHGTWFLDNTGDTDFRVKVHKWVRETDPAVEIFTNDFNIISHYHGQADKYIELVEDLASRGAPIDGIGLQAHFPAVAIDPGKMLPVLDRLAALGRPLWVTEFDWNADTNGDAAHAAAVEDFYRLVYSHPAVQGVLMWGFWDQSHWRPNGALVNGDSFTVNMAGEAYLHLYHVHWNSTTLLAPDSAGQFSARLHHGNYRLELSRGDTVLASRELSLAAGADLEIDM